MNRKILFAAALLLSSTSFFLYSQRCSNQLPPFVGYTFINANIINAEAAGALYFMDFDGLEEYYRQKGNLQKKDNVTEWHERFCEVPKEEDIRYIVYHASVEDMAQLRSAIRSPSVRLSYNTQNNSFAKYLRKNKCLETVDYLLFAKACEPFVTSSDPWKSRAGAESMMLDLISRGEKEFKAAKSHYIRLRYAYQLIRLAHYSQQYELALELYDNLLPVIKNDPSLIEDWIEGHRAGAMMALGDRIKASYIFSRIFEESPSKRSSAYRSFNIKTDEEWQQCLQYCKTDEEKATLYALRASFPNSRLLIEMKNIYAYDPSSQHLPLLLIQEMKRLEKHLLGTSFNDKRQRNKRYYGIPSKTAGNKVIALQQFTTQVLTEGLAQEPGLWWMIDGYLALLSGSYYDAHKSFAKAEQLISGGIMEEQLEVFKLVLKITEYQKITDTIEQEVGMIIAVNDHYERYEDFTDYVDDKLTDLYLKNGNTGKAFMMQYPLSYMKPNPQPEMLEDLISVCRDPNPTRLEQDMVAAGDSTILEDLLDIKATYLMSINRFEAALATYKLIKRVDWDNYGIYAPFVEKTEECVRCRLPASARPFNKGEILEQILEMEYAAKAGTIDVGLAYYRIGLALYNMSYFSHAWKAMDYYRSGSSLNTSYLQDGDNIIPSAKYPYGNKENFDCTQARYYFERARLATDSTDLAAKATFMAAKCERNEYYINRWQADAVQTFDNFQILLESYYQTEFCQQMLQECLYFNIYANRYYELD